MPTVCVRGDRRAAAVGLRGRQSIGVSLEVLMASEGRCIEPGVFRNPPARMTVARDGSTSGKQQAAARVRGSA